MFLASSAFDKRKNILTVDVEATFAVILISSAVDSFSSITDLVQYLPSELPPTFAVSATNSGVVPDIGLLSLFCIK